MTHDADTREAAASELETWLDYAGQGNADERTIEAATIAVEVLRTAPVDTGDLLALLDYTQPDEERDIANLEPGNSAEDHIVHVIRRLRKAVSA